MSLSLEVSDGFLPPSRSCCASAAIFCDDQHGARRLVSANRGRRYKRLTVYAAMRVDVTTARMSSHLAAAHEVHREEAVVNMTTLFVAAVDVTSSCRGGQDDKKNVEVSDFVNHVFSRCFLLPSHMTQLMSTKQSIQSDLSYFGVSLWGCCPWGSAWTCQ